MAITFVRDPDEAALAAGFEERGAATDRTVVNVEHLQKAYGGVKAVDDISFAVRQGEIFGMLGPNGAGKTTTVEMVEGLRQPDSGRIELLGSDMSRNANGTKQRIGVQLQVPSLLPLLSVAETLALFGRVYKRSIPVERLLDMFALQESRKTLVKNLSGGQQQRLSVAMAMVNDPDILFLDEPTTGLDPQARHSLWTVVEGVRSRGKTVFLTTHYMEEAERLCDRVAIMDHGKIIALDSPPALIRSNFKESAIQFQLDPAPPKETLMAFTGAVEVVIENGETVIYSTDIPATMSCLLTFAQAHGLTGQLKNVFVRQATLEDVFLKITGRRIRS